MRNERIHDLDYESPSSPQRQNVRDEITRFNPMRHWFLSFLVPRVHHTGRLALILYLPARPRLAEAVMSNDLPENRMTYMRGSG